MTSSRSTFRDCRTPPVSWRTENLLIWKYLNENVATLVLQIKTKTVGWECKRPAAKNVLRPSESTRVGKWRRVCRSFRLRFFAGRKSDDPISFLPSRQSANRRHFGPLCIGIVEIECWYCVTWLPTRRVGWPSIIENVQLIIEIRARYANLGLLQVRIIFSSGKAWPFLEFQQDSVLKNLFLDERWRRYLRLLEHVTQRVMRGVQLDWWLVSILISQNACNG